MTRQLNSIIYNKLVLQAEEAREQNLIKLAYGRASSGQTQIKHIELKSNMDSILKYDLDERLILQIVHRKSYIVHLLCYLLHITL